jgi:hypothetical protein
MAWAWRQGIGAGGSLDVLVDGDGSSAAAGVIARRAGCFVPAPTVWAVSGRDLRRASPAAPVSDSAESPPPSLVSLLTSHGLEVVWEHGVLRGEVLGLEVARTVGSHLEVGVGRYDRAARLEMRPGEDLSSALSEAAGAVRSLRRLGAPAHPANSLARSRWLRSVVVSSPASFGFSSLVPVSPPLPWFDLSEAGVAPAVGESLSGNPVVVVCSVGVDLDLVPTAADCWLLYGGGGGAGAGAVAGGEGARAGAGGEGARAGGEDGEGARAGAGGEGARAGGEDAGPGPVAELWLVVPEGDVVAATRGLAGWLAPPARILTVGRGWEAGGG